MWALQPSFIIIILFILLFIILFIYYIIIILDVSPSTHLFSAENKHKEAVANSWVFT